MIVAALLGLIVIIGILAGYNPFDFLAPPDENRKPGTWAAPLAPTHQEEDIEGNPRLLPQSESIDGELE